METRKKCFGHLNELKDILLDPEYLADCVVQFEAFRKKMCALNDIVVTDELYLVHETAVNMRKMSRWACAPSNCFHCDDDNPEYWIRTEGTNVEWYCKTCWNNV